MGQDEELEILEEGIEVEAKLIEGETEQEDVGGFQDVENIDSNQGESDLEDDYELVELELDEDDIVRYLEDDEGNRVGFVLMEDGEEAEYLYVEDDEDSDEFDFGITKEDVAQVTGDANAIYKDGLAVAAELKGAFDDIKEALDFSSFLKK